MEIDPKEASSSAGLEFYDTYTSPVRFRRALAESCCKSYLYTSLRSRQNTQSFDCQRTRLARAKQLNNLDAATHSPHISSCRQTM